MTRSTNSTLPPQGETRDRRFAQTRSKRPPVQAKHLVFGGVLLALLLAAVYVSYHGAYVAPMQEPMVRVNDTVFTLGDYVGRLRRLDAEGKMVGQPANFSTDPFKLLEDLVNEELIRQGAPRMGVVVSEDEVTKALKAQLGAVLKQQDGLSDAELDKQFQELLAQRLNDVNLTNDQYRAIVRNQLVSAKLRDQLSARVPAVAQQIHLEGFKTNDMQTAQTLAGRWKKGEDLRALSRDPAVDQDTRDNLGDIGWIPQRAFDPGVDEFLWKLPAGTISDPFYANPGYYVVRVVSQAPELRQVEGVAREKLKDRALSDWLDEERKANRVERYFDSKRYDYVVDKVREYLR